MILEKNQLPAAPRGHRIMTKPFPPRDQENGIAIPDIAKMHPNVGVIVHAGLNARDSMHDHGDEVGDEIWWGKYAGVIEEWDRITAEGPNYKKCRRRHRWTRLPSPSDRTAKWECSKCKSVRTAEPLIVMNVDDILCNVSAQRRSEKGKASIKRGKTPDGRTQHFIDRKAK